MYNRPGTTPVPHLLTFVMEIHFVAEFDAESGAWESVHITG